VAPVRLARANGGHVVMPASLSRDDAITLARTRMERDLIATARRSQPAGARDKIRMLGAEYPRESCGLALLPVWRFDDVRAGRRWRIAVNGVTGRTAGRRIA